MKTKPEFPHRLNNNGTFDSICDTCYATVARVRVEAELAAHEAQHVCDPLNLFPVSQRYSISGLITPWARGHSDTD